MIKALVLKELRESAGIVALALLGMIYALAVLTGTQLLPWMSNYIYVYPFVSDNLGFYFALIAGGLAVALGLRQTAWELVTGTYYFLLHRPVSRRTLFAVKLIVGAALVVALGTCMLLGYALWASRPGSIPAPFEWSMTYPAWRWWLAMPVLYLAAFLSGIREGAWFASRLVPLVTGIALAMLVGNLPWFWLSALLAVPIMALELVCIFTTVKSRDY